MLELWKDKIEEIFRTFCRSPLLGANHKQEINDEVYIKDIEGENPPFLLPINPYFGFHPAFYRVTGTDETGAALSLSIKAENEGLRLRILDVEGRVKEDYSNYV